MVAPEMKSSLPMQPPEYIDGALVLEWAWSDVPFGTVACEDGSLPSAIHGLAICRYEGEGQVYRFSCNAEWACEQDQTHDSVVQAKSELPAQYKSAPRTWVRRDCEVRPEPKEQGRIG